MYAVIETGGKQYRVSPKQKLKIEKIELAVESDFDFDKVLLVGEGDSVKVGTPLLQDGKVSAKVIAHGRRDKINILKFKRRKNYLKRQGHRQSFTQVEITEITG